MAELHFADTSLHKICRKLCPLYTSPQALPGQFRLTGLTETIQSNVLAAVALAEAVGMTAKAMATKAIGLEAAGAAALTLQYSALALLQGIS
jgi:hypothetical protein